MGLWGRGCFYAQPALRRNRDKHSDTGDSTISVRTDIPKIRADSIGCEVQSQESPLSKVDSPMVFIFLDVTVYFPNGIDYRDRLTRHQSRQRGRTQIMRSASQACMYSARYLLLLYYVTLLINPNALCMLTDVVERTC